MPSETRRRRGSTSACRGSRGAASSSSSAPATSAPRWTFPLLLRSELRSDKLRPQQRSCRQVTHNNALLYRSASDEDVVSPWEFVKVLWASVTNDVFDHACPGYFVRCRCFLDLIALAKLKASIVAVHLLLSGLLSDRRGHVVLRQPGPAVLARQLRQPILHAERLLRG